MATAAHQEKRVKERSPKKDTRKKVKKDLLQGFALKDCGGSGACGYNSIAVALQATVQPTMALPDADQAQTLGKTLRQKIHQHITSHQADYEAAWSPDSNWTVTTEGGPIPSSFPEWLSSLLRPSRWICQHTLVAASRRLGVHITVLYEKDGAIQPIQMRSGSFPRGGGCEDPPNAPSTPMNRQPTRVPPTTAGGATTNTPNWLPKHTPYSSGDKTPTWFPKSTPKHSASRSKQAQTPTWLPKTTPRSKIIEKAKPSSSRGSSHSSRKRTLQALVPQHIHATIPNQKHIPGLAIYAACA